MDEYITIHHISNHLSTFGQTIGNMGGYYLSEGQPKRVNYNSQRTSSVSDNGGLMRENPSNERTSKGHLANVQKVNKEHFSNVTFEIFPLTVIDLPS